MPMNPRLLRPLARQAGALPPSGTPASLLLRFDGNFNDSSPNALTVTANGDAAISTTIKKYGSGSLSLSSGYLSSASYSDVEDFGSGDWTLEAWVWRPSGILNATILNLAKQSVAPFGLHLWVGEDNQVRWDEGSVECAVGGAVPTEQWTHIAAVRLNGTTTIYVDGVDVGSSATPPQSGPYKVWVGAYDSIGGTREFVSEMLIDDLRVVKGLAVYTGNFTPPTGPLSVNATPVTPSEPTDPYFSNVSLLLHMDGANDSTTFTDSSLNARTVTAHDDAQIDTSEKQFGTGSALFDGDDYLAVPGIDWDGTGDFAVEFWMYVENVSAYQHIVGCGDADTGHMMIALLAPFYGAGAIGIGRQNIEWFTATSSIQNETWHHVAVSRSGSSLYFFVDGAALPDTPITSSASFPVGTLYIGSHNIGGSLSGAFARNIDDFRLTIGSARGYTGASIPVPIAPFPNQ